MDEAVSIIHVEIPRAVYERQIINLVDALLALDAGFEGIDGEVLEGEGQGSGPGKVFSNPKEAA
jgi:hypothetical protein